MARDKKPRGKMEFVFAFAIVVVVGLTARIVLDPNASLSTKEYIDIIIWVMETIEGIADPGGAI